ncbi:hypothetical protein QJS04_geneDACA008690 [Acorus gramineus]|uniref:RRM domain-containing protein n=1 Tax=Acorus gramineus TaxID=55184 RepID=A0AAV9AC01_ACOGR|nr:hypothetical protein QJS04_geneDACA008690 [Acorus gramineus]
MPPRVAKRSPVGHRIKKAAATSVVLRPPKPAEVPMKVEENVVVEKVKQPKLEANRDFPMKDEEDVKVAYGEEDNGECLELEDNEPEYEPEHPLMDDDGDGEDIVHEDIYDVEVDVEEEDLDEEAKEDEMIDEISEYGGDDIEGEEDDEHIHEEHEAGEEEECHEMVKECCKRNEFEVFVGGLDRDATEDDLRKTFSEVGQVTEVRLMMNSQTKKNKDGLPPAWDENHVEYLKKFGVIEKIELARKGQGKVVETPSKGPGCTQYSKGSYNWPRDLLRWTWTLGSRATSHVPRS